MASFAVLVKNADISRQHDPHHLTQNSKPDNTAGGIIEIVRLNANRIKRNANVHTKDFFSQGIGKFLSDSRKTFSLSTDSIRPFFSPPRNTEHSELEWADMSPFLDVLETFKILVDFINKELQIQAFAL